MQGIESNNGDTAFCWNKDHYKKVEFVSWNSQMIPLIAQGKSIRKITPREVARLKGIPDEYSLSVQNKSWLYQKLMYCSNVQLIQQIASAISIDAKDEYFQRREISKGDQFEKIIISFFENIGIDEAGLINGIDTNMDYQIQIGEETYSFVFKIYRNNHGIKEKLIAACERIYRSGSADGENNIFIIGNIVDKETKRIIEERFQI